MRAIRFAGRFGSQLDPATDAALKKDASLEGISGERIRDEFIKGLQSAKSQKHFLELIEKYGLFQWIFKGLSVDKSVISKSDKDDYVVLLARLLKGNSIESLKKTLNALKYTIEEVKAITFLVGLTKLSVDTAVTLKRAEQHSGVTPDQIKAFAKEEGLDTKLIEAFLKFRLTVSGQEVMDKFNLKPSKEVGDKVHQIETDNFKKLV
jgi:tRNA nucleotidyltransferase/poly(A) polymerase